MSAPSSINLEIDSGATHHFHEIGSTDLPQQQTSNYNPEARLIVPNNAYMVSSTTMHLPIPYLPPSATKSYGFNHPACRSIFFVGQDFDHNVTAVFFKTICKNLSLQNSVLLHFVLPSSNITTVLRQNLFFWCP